MKHVSKSVLIWYSPQEMYDLVTAVEDYPQFLPWCERAEILERTDDGMTARLHLAFAGVRYAFTTRNRQQPHSLVAVSLVDGPFSELSGTWQFHSLGEQERACKIDFELKYAFASGPLELVVSPVFDRIANTFVDSFVKRAEQLMEPDDDAAALQITVAYSPQAGVVQMEEISLMPGATVRDALQKATLFETAPLAADDTVGKLGIWGRPCTVDSTLQPGDRVEVYRPLTVDPKEARRLRQRSQRVKKRMP